jgi:hypothetical protein
VPLLVIPRGPSPSLVSGSWLNTVMSPAVGLECVVLIFMAGSASGMNVQVRTCDGLLAPYSLEHPSLKPVLDHVPGRERSERLEEPVVINFVERRGQTDTSETDISVARQQRWSLWVPNRSSMSCDLGIFVDQSTEPVTTSEAKLGW